MFRTQAIRSFQTAASHTRPIPTSNSTSVMVPAAKTARGYATYTPPPPAGQPAPNPMAANAKPDNTLLYTGLGLAGAAGAYLYFRGSDEEPLDAKKRQDNERIRVNARETTQAMKDRANDTIEMGRMRVDQAEARTRETAAAARDRAAGTYDSARDSVKDTYGSARDKTRDSYYTAKDRVESQSDVTEAERRRRGLLDPIEETLDSAKHKTKETLGSARSSTENLFHDARHSLDRKGSEIRQDVDRTSANLRRDVDKKGEEAKEGWFSWMNAGKEKLSEQDQALRDRELRLQAEADRLKREAAARVASGAEAVRARAEKHV